MAVSSAIVRGALSRLCSVQELHEAEHGRKCTNVFAFVGRRELNIVRKRMHPEISEWQVSIRNTEPSLFPNLQIST